MKQRGKFLLFVLAFAFSLILSSNFCLAGELKVTQEHPFLINGVWIPAYQLKAGDNLTTIEGKNITIKNIKDIETTEPFFVYNLEDDYGINNFVVGNNNIIVHNSEGKKKNIIISLFSGARIDKKPPFWSNDDYFEYLLSRSPKEQPPIENIKRPVVIGEQIAHSRGDRNLPGSGGAVFFEEFSDGIRVVKALRGDKFIEDMPFGRPISFSERVESALGREKYYMQEIENLKLADRLGLRKFYGEVEIQNLDRLLKNSVYPINKNLLAKRAYSMDYVGGGWPSEMRQFITEKTLEDALSKYKLLYDAGYVQMDFQFLVTRQGTIEIIDWGSVAPKENVPWSRIESNIRKDLGYD